MSRWIPLARAERINNPERDAALIRDAKHVMEANGYEYDEAHIRAILDDEKSLPIWKNLDYQVAVRTTPTDMERGDGKPGMVNLVHLSIKRIDRKPLRDWRALQAIKNQLLGEQCEAVELFPAEARLADNANQYHLWGYDDATFRFPFGFQERMVSDYVSPESGVMQRPFDK